MFRTGLPANEWWALFGLFSSVFHQQTSVSADHVNALERVRHRQADPGSGSALSASSSLAFVLAMRLAPRFKPIAGAVALLFALASPAHRAYAVDVMIESMGAALTLPTMS